MAPLTRTGDVNFAHVSDQELLASTRRLVGATNQILAELLTHLAEVEARGVHRDRLCTSLYTYCVYELRFSEDAAYRRVSAARLVQRFPVLYDAIAGGELHLTGLLMLGPHLTAENIESVLPRAKHRTKKELAQLVRQLDPLPDVPAGIVPLGPAIGLQSKPRKPTWGEYVRSFNPVNHLPAGDRPRDWMSDTPFSLVTETPENTQTIATDAPPPTAPARFEPLGLQPLLAPLEPPQRYQVQFTAGQEYVDLVERAKALLSHTSIDGLVDLHLRAMRAFVAELEKRKYALTDSARSSASESASGSDSGALAISHSGTPGSSGALAKSVTRRPRTPTRERQRNIPAAVRRAVAARDGQRCAYIDEHGRRCPETHQLEFHHILAFVPDGTAPLGLGGTGSAAIAATLVSNTWHKAAISSASHNSSATKLSRRGRATHTWPTRSTVGSRSLVRMR